jgi:hypothetical protein
MCLAIRGQGFLLENTEKSLFNFAVFAIFAIFAANSSSLH